MWDNGKGMDLEDIHFRALSRGMSPAGERPTLNPVSWFATGANAATAKTADGDVLLASVKRGSNIGTLCRHVRAPRRALSCAS